MRAWQRVNKTFDGRIKATLSSEIAPLEDRNHPDARRSDVDQRDAHCVRYSSSGPRLVRENDTGEFRRGENGVEGDLEVDGLRGCRESGESPGSNDSKGRRRTTDGLSIRVSRCQMLP